MSNMYGYLDKSILISVIADPDSGRQLHLFFGSCPYVTIKVYISFLSLHRFETISAPSQ